MLTSIAQVPVDRPERYLKQLVAHLGRRRTARLAPPRGQIEWPDGSCALLCEPGLLVLTATGADVDALARVQDAVARHLERFGARDQVRVRWTPAG